MTIQEAVKVLVKNLKEDKDYRMTWQANIAMSFFDQYENISGPMDSSQRNTIHTIANKAADNFLDTLCMDYVETQSTPSPHLENEEE